MAEPSISDLKTDERIGDILKRLQSANNKQKQMKPKPKLEVSSNEESSDGTESVNSKPSVDVRAVKSEPVVNNTAEVVDASDDNSSIIDSAVEAGIIKEKPSLDNTLKNLAKYNFVEEAVLPWFSSSDKDSELMHYLKVDSSGNLVYSSVNANKPASDIAALKLKQDYICDVDYYKSKHYVLYVKQFDSSYSSERVYTPSTDATVEDSLIANESASPSLKKVATDDVATLVAEEDKYYRYIVFTDLGVADFVSRQEETKYPYSESDLSTWFEETSNFVSIKNAKYDANSNYKLSDSVKSFVKDYHYDLITMHRPGVITLDSTDNESDDPIHITVKDEVNFLPMDKVLSCLKRFASADNKFDAFREFVNRYFYVMS